MSELESIADELREIVKELHRRANISAISNPNNAIQIHKEANKIEDCALKLDFKAYKEEK